MEGRSKAARVIFHFFLTLIITFLAVLVAAKSGIFGRQEESMTFWMHVLSAMYIPTLVAFINCMYGLGFTDSLHDFWRKRLLLSPGYMLLNNQFD